MPGNVKGITIEFRGDTTTLDKAIRQINNETKGLDKQLKAVDKSLKFNPNNTILLTQKQDLLRKSVAETTDKLELLKREQEEMKAAGVEENSKEYQALQREIIYTENQLKKFKEELYRVADVKLTQLSQQFQDVGAKMETTGKAMTKYITVPLLAVGAAAIKVGLDFNSEMSKVQAISGATGTEFDALREKAKQLGASTKFTATESAQAFEYMAMAGWKVEDMLAGVDGVMNLAAASGADLATTSDIVTDAMTAFGLQASDASHFADVLAQASASANTNVEMLGESFKYVAPVAGSLGYSIEDVSIALGLMANSGIKSSQAGTSLRQALSQLVNPTEAAASALDYYGISLSDGSGNAADLMSVMKDLRATFGGVNVDVDKLNEAVEEGGDNWQTYVNNVPTDEMEKLQAITQIFGTRSMPAMLSIINASEEDFNKLTESIYGAEGAAEKMADTMLDNNAGALTILKSALEGAALELDDRLAPAMRNIIETAQRYVTAFNNLDKSTQDAIIKFGLLVAAGGPVLTVLGKMTSGWGKLLGVTPKVIDGMLKLAGKEGFGSVLEEGTKANLLLGQITKVVANAGPWAAGAAAVAGFALVIKESYDHLHRFTQAQQEMQQAHEDEIRSLQSTSQETEWYIQHLEELSAKENKSAIDKEVIQNYVNNLNSSIKDLNLTYDEETDSLNMSTDAIYSKIDAIEAEMVAEAYKKQAGEITNEMVKNQIELTKMQEKQSELLTKAKEAEAEGNIRLAQEYRAQAESVTADIDNMTQAQEGYETELDKVMNMQERMTVMSSDSFKSLVETAKKTGADVNSALDDLELGLGEVPDSVWDMVLMSDPAFADMVADAKAAGVAIPTDVKTGINNGTMSVTTATSILRRSVESELSKTDGRTPGQNSSAGYAGGIGSGADSAGTAAKKVKDKAVSNLKDGGQASSKGSDFGHGYASGISSNSVLQSVANAAARLVTAAINAIKSKQKSASPAKETMKLGGFFGEGYALGIEAEKDSAVAAAEDVAEAAMKALSVTDLTIAGMKRTAVNVPRLATSTSASTSQVESVIQLQSAAIEQKNAEIAYLMQEQTKLLALIYEETVKPKNFKVDGVWAGRYINDHVR